jgi:hypothetical protein
MSDDVGEIEKNRTERTAIRTITIGVVIVLCSLVSSCFVNAQNEEEADRLKHLEEQRTEQEAIMAGYPPEWVYCMFHKKDNCTVINSEQRGGTSSDTTNNPSGDLPVEEGK